MESYTEMSCADLAEALAAKQPVPGGGGAAALTGALAAALCSMVANYTVGNKKYADVEDDVKRLLTQADIERVQLLQLIDEDAKAFEPLAEAYKIPKEDLNRADIIEGATADAARAPREMMFRICNVIALLEQLDFVPCAAVAHSFGCRVAAWAASEWPELFTRLVFTGAAGLRAPQTEEGRKRAESYQQKKRFLHRLEQLPFLHSVGESLEERLRQKYGSADYNALDAEMRQTFVKVIQLDLRDRYPLIQQSTLLLWGDEDRETPLWMGREMEKLIPDAGLVLLEGGSHFAYLEQAQRFGTIVQHFLADG